MNNIRPASVDEIQHYLAHGVLLHPSLHTTFFDQLDQLCAKGKISLLPLTRLDLYHYKLSKQFARSRVA